VLDGQIEHRLGQVVHGVLDLRSDRPVLEQVSSPLEFADRGGAVREVVKDLPELGTAGQGTAERSHCWLQL